MKVCKRCGSQAINDQMHGRLKGTDLDLCDVCYWRSRVEVLKADNGRLYDLLNRGEIIAKEIHEENKLALAVKDKRVEELEKLSAHCDRCGGDYAQTGVEVGCNCELVTRVAELEETIRYWIAVDNRIVNNAVNPESRLAAKARIIAMKSALKAEETDT